MMLYWILIPIRKKITGYCNTHSDVIEIKILGPDQLEPLAVEMEEISILTGTKFFLRDAGNTRQGGACLQIGCGRHVLSGPSISGLRSGRR